MTSRVVGISCIRHVTASTTLCWLITHTSSLGYRFLHSFYAFPPKKAKLTLILSGTAGQRSGQAELPTASRTLTPSRRHTLTHSCYILHFPVFLGLLPLDGLHKTSTRIDFPSQTVGAQITTTSASASSQFFLIS